MTTISPSPEPLLLPAAAALRLPLLVVDADGRVEAAGPGVAELLAVPDEELLGAELRALASDPDQVDGLLRRFRRSGSPLPGALRIGADEEERAVRLDGVRMPSEGRAQVLLVLHREPAEGFVVVQEKLSALAREIQLRRTVQEEYRALLQREKQARRRAEDADRMKDEFLSIVSHELRTPLNAIVSWTQILRMDASSPETQAPLGRIQRNAHALAALIEDLLDASRIVSNQVELEVRSVSLAELAREALDAVRPFSESKDIRLVSKGPADARAELDPVRIRQVLRHLLENAIKFSSDGGGVVLEFAADDERSSFHVRDEGEGLREAELEVVFDRFRTGDARPQRAHGGMGIGLTVAKQLVELHGGTIHAASAGPEQGAVFSFELPRRINGDSPVAETLSRQPVEVDATALEGVRILVVEDNPDARDALVHFLESIECDAVGVGSVRAALSEIESEAPALIVTDLQMPEQDGYDLLRQVREDERSRTIPVLAVTAHAQREDRKRALAAGFDAYLAKPVRTDDLVGALRRFRDGRG